MLALAAAACSGDDGDDASDDAGGDAGGGIEATPAALAQAAQDSAGELYHSNTSVSVNGPEISLERRAFGTRFHTGATDGERYQATADGRAILEALTQPADPIRTSLVESGALERSLDVVGDASDLYIRGPVLAELPQLAPPDAPRDSLESLAQLGNAWGRIDLGAFEDRVPADAPNVLRGIEGAGDVGRTFLGLLSDVSDVEELGDQEVHGTQTTGLAAEVSAAEVFAALGDDPDAVRTGAIDEDTREIVGRLDEVTVPVELWVGREGLIYRMTIDRIVDDIATAMNEDPAQLADALTAAGFDGLDLTYSTDYFDFGIPVPVQFPDDAVDVTDAFVALAGESTPPADS